MASEPILSTESLQRSKRETELKSYIESYMQKLTIESLEALLGVARALPRKKNEL